VTQDEMIDLAKQAGWQYAHGESGFEPLWDFAKLVEEKAIEETKARTYASWTLMCKKMVALEREACANLVEESSLPDTYSQECLPDIANEIRARGEQA
jgi:hypothetical protein